MTPVHVHESHFFKNRFNIILQSIPGPSKRSLSLKVPHKKPVRTCLFPHYLPYTLCSAHLLILDRAPAYIVTRTYHDRLLTIAIFSTLLLRTPSHAKIYSSVPSCRTFSAYFHPLMCTTKFIINTKKRQNYVRIF